MKCISIVSYSLLINCNSNGIQLVKRIMQGDPLSPCIFILCVEFLGRELIMYSKNPKNHIGIQTHRHGLRIPYLMFADDCINFFQSLK